MAKSCSASRSRSSTPSAPTPRRRSQSSASSARRSAGRYGSRWSTTTKSFPAPCIFVNGILMRSSGTSRLLGRPHQDELRQLDHLARMHRDLDLLASRLLVAFPDLVAVEVPERPHPVGPRVPGQIVGSLR